MLEHLGRVGAVTLLAGLLTPWPQARAQDQPLPPSVAPQPNDFGPPPPVPDDVPPPPPGEGLQPTGPINRPGDVPPPPATEDGVEVQARGPVHEAYAAPSQATPVPGPVVSKQPPEPV